jgi:hypothetical protein
LTSTLIPAAPADVLAVPGGGTAGWLIRIGEIIAGKPSPAGHVVIVTHQDVKGRWIGIQGQPGGVSLCDCTPFLSDSRTRTNHAQPRPDVNGNRQLTFLAGAVKSLGISYDWAGIAEDVSKVIAPNLSAEIDGLWRWPSDRNLLPGHVVCSSLAAMLYDLPAVDWGHPDLGTERVCLPSDWYTWNDKKLWAS